MIVFAITAATAAWVLGKANLLDALHALLTGERQDLDLLRDRILVEDSMRLSAKNDLSIVAFWNVDYATSSGEESWGFIDLSEETGISKVRAVSREALERALYIVSQRSQGLLLDGAYIHRSHASGAHTCLAGRGREARQFSLGYVERSIGGDMNASHVIAVTGPESDLTRLAATAGALDRRVDGFLTSARLVHDGATRLEILPKSNLESLRAILTGFSKGPDAESEFASVSVTAGPDVIPVADSLRTSDWSYEKWIAAESPLSEEQRRLLNDKAILRHPVRITGPAGSGKTLLMQLLAIWRVRAAPEEGDRPRILYLVHNQKMAEMVRHRFEVLLWGETAPDSESMPIEILTLSEYARSQLSLDADEVIDRDAQAAKEFQLETLQDAISKVFHARASDVEESKLFANVNSNEKLRLVFCQMVMAEISIAIKGRGLESDSKRYEESERILSRMHGMLSPSERKVVFSIFRSYHETMFDGYNVLDSDDVAISLLGRLRTPIWQLKRREQGYDHVFVDETQLFNENERRIFALLPKSTTPYVPVVMALDDAQEFHGQTTAGLATLGIEDVASENLSSIHRSSLPIIRLAFFVIQRSSDLFNADFPDFTTLEVSSPDTQEQTPCPKVMQVTDPKQTLYRFVVKTIRSLRKSNQRRIAVVCMAEQYWQGLNNDLRGTDLPLHVLEHRGERLPMRDPVVALSRPTHIGGQEFEAVIIVGAEEGVTPPRVVDNDALATAVEQQALRELYLSITRAQKYLYVVISHGAALSPVLADAVGAGHLDA